MHQIINSTPLPPVTSVTSLKIFVRSHTRGDLADPVGARISLRRHLRHPCNIDAGCGALYWIHGRHDPDTPSGGSERTDAGDAWFAAMAWLIPSRAALALLVTIAQESLKQRDQGFLI